MTPIRILAMIARRQRGLDLLARMGVRDLMALRDQCYRVNRGRIYDEDQQGVNIWSKYGPWVSMAEIKAELAKRPHVPNKVERQEARRAKAKAGRQRGRRDR